MTANERTPVETAVTVTVKGKDIPATVTGHKDTRKGLFYVTTDAAGKARSARPAHVRLHTPIV